MPTIDFPNSPTVNQQFTAGGKIWQWSGTAWDVVRIAVPAASLTSTDVSRLTGATSNLQTQINTLSTNLGNTLDDYVPIGDVGVADGVASLDATGKIPIAQLGNLIDGAPAALDTLNELAAALGNDSSYAATITTALGNKAPIASPTFTGTVTIPTGSVISGVPYLNTGNTFTGGVQQITTASAATKGLIVKATSSQTANLMEFQNSSGTILSHVTSSGQFSIGSVTSPGGILGVSTGSVNARGIVIRGVFSQAANLQEWQNSAGSVIAQIQSTGAFNSSWAGTFGTLSNLSSTTLGAVAINSTIVPLVAKGYASQTANLQEWQNSAGTVLAKVDSSGIGHFASGVFAYGAASIDGGGGAVLAAIYTGGLRNSATSYNFFSNLTDSPYATVVVKQLSGQTTNLQEWQNSAGTVLSKITASGALDVTAITVNGSAITGGGLTPVAVSTNITMAANNRYFVNTTSARTLTLPITPALGAEIELYDSSNNAFTNNVSILRNGEKINGLTDDAALDINGFAVSFIYTGSTYGWRIK